MNTPFFINELNFSVNAKQIHSSNNPPKQNKKTEQNKKKLKIEENGLCLQADPNSFLLFLVAGGVLG